MTDTDDTAEPSFRRTLVGLKPPDVTASVRTSTCFRRTLVGLKLPMIAIQLFAYWFQTNPCGVEAVEEVWGSSHTTPFQTNPCGVEAGETELRFVDDDGFQTNPCGVEATLSPSRRRSPPVSDEPLWG